MALIQFDAHGDGLAALATAILAILAIWQI
jgi:hypothetical protein